MWQELAILGVLKAEGRPRSYGFIARHLGGRYYYNIVRPLRNLEEKGFVTTYHQSDGIYSGGGSKRMAKLAA